MLLIALDQQDAQNVLYIIAIVSFLVLLVATYLWSISGRRK